MTKSTNNSLTSLHEQTSVKAQSSNSVLGDKREGQQGRPASKKDDDIQTLHKSDSVRTSSKSAPKPVESAAKSVKPKESAGSQSIENQDNRRLALRSMLASSEARQQNAIRARRPTPVAGLRVGIRNGQFKGLAGTILDADYIQSRALLDIEAEEKPQWIDFDNLHSLIEA